MRGKSPFKSSQRSASPLRQLEQTRPVPVIIKEMIDQSTLSKTKDLFSNPSDYKSIGKILKLKKELHLSKLDLKQQEELFPPELVSIINKDHRYWQQYPLLFALLSLQHFLPKPSIYQNWQEQDWQLFFQLGSPKIARDIVKSLPENKYNEVKQHFANYVIQIEQTQDHSHALPNLCKYWLDEFGNDAAVALANNPNTSSLVLHDVFLARDNIYQPLNGDLAYALINNPNTTSVILHRVLQKYYLLGEIENGQEIVHQIFAMKLANAKFKDINTKALSEALITQFITDKSANESKQHLEFFKLLDSLPKDFKWEPGNASHLISLALEASYITARDEVQEKPFSPDSRQKLAAYLLNSNARISQEDLASLKAISNN